MIGLLLCLFSLATTPTAEPVVELAEATRTYDLSRAQALVASLKQATDSDSVALRVKAHLLVAELLRLEFSYLPATETKTRRALGKQIDAAADAGLADLDGLPESSEKHRLKADLFGTKIRSTYRAGKLKGPLNAAVERALQLDPENARAYVTKAKTLLFQPSPTEGALQEALRLLKTARSREPTLEQIRLLLAYAYTQTGDTEAATECWQQCLQENPDCLPAARELNSVRPD